MKSKYLFLVVLIWGVLLGVCSCSEDDDAGSIFHPTPSDTVTIYPRKIPYTSIEEKLKWKTQKQETPSPVVVNSKKQLLQYVEGESDFYSGIDFSKHSVLLIHGVIDYGVSNIVVQDFQIGYNAEYFLRVLLVLTLQDIESHWVTAIITEKLDENVAVQVYVSNVIELFGDDI